MSTMTTDVRTSTLTRDDLTALQRADSITFHRTAMGENFIRAHLSGWCKKIRTAAEQRIFDVIEQGGDRHRQIAVDASIMRYERDSSSRTLDTVQCFYMIHSARHDDAWRTVANLLRIGDELRLDWRADNNSDTLRSHNLHADMLNLIVGRPYKGSEHRRTRQTFPIARTVTPDNTARMVRFFG